MNSLSEQYDIIRHIVSFCDEQTKVSFKLSCKKLFNCISINRLRRTSLIGIDFFFDNKNESGFFEAIRRLYIKPFQNKTKMLFCYKYKFKSSYFNSMYFEVFEVESFVELYYKVGLYRFHSNDNLVIWYLDKTRSVTLDEFFMNNIGDLKLNPQKLQNT